MSAMPKIKNDAKTGVFFLGSGAQIRTEDLRVMSSNLDFVYFYEQLCERSLLAPAAQRN
jgi:hypothetical protein